RGNRQVAADAESFRARSKQVLAAAEQAARALGYSGTDVRSALFAVVAFLDESVLNSPQPMFADWSRRPLQEELFGGHVAGEVFFENLRALLEAPDSDDTADVLEVYELCLLLGFRGRYGATGASELQAIAARIGAKIERIRGPYGPFSPEWALPGGETVATTTDPWLKRGFLIAALALLLAVALYAGYRVSLSGAASSVATAGARA
ncbi:MAG: DotU family type IV/VI secretion system protein, partial [Gemmatimonadota bacterium]|nr:DotU family type IV/VI secretion system protein [Gemmatimonadota bacterium]